MSETKFYTCRWDAAFKEIFMKEDNKDILISLLEKCLSVKISDIFYLNVEDLVDNVHVRRKSYDLRLSTNIGIIQVEINSNIYHYSRERQMAYISNEFSHYVLRGDNYKENIQIIQINFTYGLMTEFREEKYKYLYDEEDYRIYEVRDKKGKKFLPNFKIYEFNMDYYMNLWYTKDKEKIEENKLLIMMDLKPNELVKISKNDKVVSKYMEEVKKINEDARFVHFMTEEEDRRKMENTIKAIAKEEGIEEGINLGREEGKKVATKEIIKNLFKNHIDIDTISKVSGLTKEEIGKIVES